MLAKSARFVQAQVAHVDVETSVGHAAIGTGGYARDHHITANNAWHPGLWSAAPVYSAALTETLASDAYPLELDAATLADLWVHGGGALAVTREAGADQDFSQRRQPRGAGRLDVRALRSRSGIQRFRDSFKKAARRICAAPHG